MKIRIKEDRKALNWPLNYFLLEVLLMKRMFCAPLLFIFPVRQRVRVIDFTKALKL